MRLFTARRRIISAPVPTRHIMARAAVASSPPMKREAVIVAVMPVLAIGGILLRLISGRLSARDEGGQSVHLTRRLRPCVLRP
jgi:hypothetical protein